MLCQAFQTKLKYESLELSTRRARMERGQKANINIQTSLNVKHFCLRLGSARQTKIPIGAEMEWRSSSLMSSISLLPLRFREFITTLLRAAFFSCRCFRQIPLDSVSNQEKPKRGEK
jgi:hypothetical protein